MKKLHILFCFSIILLPNFLFGQKNDWQESNLKGRIIQLTTDTYSARDKFGEPVKEHHEETKMVWFTENGYIRRTQSHKIPQQYYEKEMTKCQDYIYDKNKNLCCIVESEINQKELSGILFKQKDTIKIIENIFDASNRLIESNTYNKEHNLLDKTKHRYIGNTQKSITYDKNGYATKETTVITEDRKQTVKSGGVSISEEYDTNGRMIKSIFYLSVGNGSAAEIHYIKYNQYGDVISNSVNVEDLTKTGVKLHEYANGISYKYEYDKLKNWIVRREYKNGKIRSIQERKIIYATSTEDFRQAEAKEAKKDRILAKAPIRAKHQVDSIRHHEDSIRRVEKYRADSILHRADSIRKIEKHRADSIRHRQDSIRKVEAKIKQNIERSKEYMDNLVRKHFQVSSVLTVKTILQKVKKITIDEDGTVFFEIKGEPKNNTPVFFSHYHSWTSMHGLKAEAYISHDAKYVAICCTLDTGEPFSMFNKAAILYINGKIYEMPGKVRKAFINQMQTKKNKLLLY